jgi:hypothetical protein
MKERRIYGNWGEVCWSQYTFFHFKFKMPSDGWDEDRVMFSIGIWHFLLSLNLWKTKPFTEFGKDSPSYGIAIHSDTFWFNWGSEVYWSFDMPWQWDMVRWDLLLPNGHVFHQNKCPIKFNLGEESYRSWHHVFDRQQPPEQIVRALSRTVKLGHTTKDGKHQLATIRLTGEEREWRWKWFKWLPFPKMIRRTVDCNSDIELGERAGSWKGGMMGWSCDWRKDESMEESFWRWYHNWDGR